MGDDTFFSFGISTKKIWDEPVHHKQLISSVWKLTTHPAVTILLTKLIERTNHNSIDKFRITAGRTPSVTDLTDFTKSSWTMDDYTDGYFRFQQNGTVFRVKLLYKQRNRNQRNWLKSVKFDFIVLAAQVMEGGKHLNNI